MNWGAVCRSVQVGGQIQVDHLRLPREDGHRHPCHGVVGLPLRSVAVRAVVKVRLEDRLHDGRVERWRAHGSVRWLIRGFRRGPQSGSHGDVSSAPPKIPYSGFSPVRLQAKVCCHQPCPSHKRPSLSAKSAYPRALPGLTCPSSLMSLLRTPPALIRYRPASGSLSSDHLGPRALCSGRVMLSLPSTLSGPIRQSRPHPLTSQAHWLYRRPRPTTWSGLRSRPSLLWVSAPSTRAVTSTSGGEAGPYPR